MLILFVVFDGLLMLVLHEVAESAVEIKLWVEVSELLLKVTRKDVERGL